jgi:hypothetical protein
MPSDKAPGLDGFIGAFFKACWEIIKDDVTDAINSLFAMNSQNFDFLNLANIVLLQKKTDALRIADFRPISFIHSIVKIFSKLLANRLYPLIGLLGLQLSKCIHKEEKHPR